jgi:Ice-binding-like
MRSNISILDQIICLFALVSPSHFSPENWFFACNTSCWYFDGASDPVMNLFRISSVREQSNTNLFGLCGRFCARSEMTSIAISWLFFPYRAAIPVTLLLAAPAAAVGRLGTASDFAILAAATVTNTGSTSVFGDIGVAPGTAITGLGSITLGGSVHITDATAALAMLDAQAAAAALSAPLIATDLSGQDLGSVGVLTPGIYRFTASAQLTGTLTLDFTSAPASAFLFLIGSELTTASASDIVVLGGGDASGVFWNIGSAATLGTGSTVVGNLIAGTSITLTTGARILCGRAIALTGAVTLDGARISRDCTANNQGSGRADFGSQGYAGIGGTVPEPATWAMLLIGTTATGAMLRRRRGAATAGVLA